MAEPLLASDASRRAYDRYIHSGDPVHEILADAIHAAEDRGVEAALTALTAMTDTSTSEYLFPSQRHDPDVLRRRIDQKLGRHG